MDHQRKACAGSERRAFATHPPRLPCSEGNARGPRCDRRQSGSDGGQGLMAPGWNAVLSYTTRRPGVTFDLSSTKYCDINTVIRNILLTRILPPL